MVLTIENGGMFVAWYKNRIGDTSTDDEALGYWIFAAGVLLGTLGILLFLGGGAGSLLRQWAIVFASGGLALVFAGPVIRLPLRRMATWLVYLGFVICIAAIVWFIVAFPDQWSSQTGQPTIIGVYAIGLLVIAIAGVFIPILTDRAELEAQVSVLQHELGALEDAMADTEADEEDLAEVIADLRRMVVDTKADEADLADVIVNLQRSLVNVKADEIDLAGVVERLQGELADTEADEADLAAKLRTIRSSQSQFELYEDRGGEWRWRLRHRNGNLIAGSGQGYTQLHNAENGMRAVRRDAYEATVRLFESEDELPAADEEFEPVEERESRGTFELYEDRAEDWSWRLRHDNGNIIADGGQGYASQGGAKNAIEGFKSYVTTADYLWPDPTAFEVYRDAAGEWRWRLIHRNGNILSDGGEGYSSRSNARRAIDSIRNHVGEMEFETYEDNSGNFRWRLRGGSGDIMADSGEGYASRDSVEDAVQRFKQYAPEADYLEIGQTAFEIYEDTAGEARWRLRHRNGNVIADSGQGYSNRSSAQNGIESVKQNAPNAGLET